MNLLEAWTHEAINFTNWLALTENLNQLGEAIGCNLELVNTDHDHLGKIITYASGLDASTVICIVKDARDEHRKAID